MNVEELYYKKLSNLELEAYTESELNLIYMECLKEVEEM